MKIRNGFVSNSSSSSFVVLLPDKFISEIDTMDLSGYADTVEYIGEHDGIFGTDLEGLATDETVREGLKKLIANGYIYEYNEGESYDIILDILKDKNFVITMLDTSSDAGLISLADMNAVMKIIS